MPKVLNFYLDDSGTRHPDHDPGSLANKRAFDRFAVDTDENEVEASKHVEIRFVEEVSCLHRTMDQEVLRLPACFKEAVDGS
jgi:hypothetical protein